MIKKIIVLFVVFSIVCSPLSSVTPKVFASDEKGDFSDSKISVSDEKDLVVEGRDESLNNNDVVVSKKPTRDTGVSKSSVSDSKNETPNEKTPKISMLGKGGNWAGSFWNTPDAGSGPSFPGGEPDATSLDGAIDFFYGFGSPSDGNVDDNHFVARWTKTVSVSEGEAGTYLFEAAVNDGFRFYIDEEEVINNWSENNGIVSQNFSYDLTEGDHDFVFEYYENTGYAFVHFDYRLFSLSGAGDAKSPYVITNCDELAQMRYDTGASYILDGPIDCTSTFTQNAVGIENQYIAYTNPEEDTYYLPFTNIIEGEDFNLYLDSVLVDPNDYTVDYENRSVVFESLPSGYDYINVDAAFYKGFNYIDSDFSGVLDGQENSISNLSISGYHDTALFERLVDGAVIKNIDFDGAIVASAEDVALITVENEGGQILNVDISGDFRSTNEDVGVVANRNKVGSTIDNVNVEANIRGYNIIGGISGGNGGSIKNVSFSGNIFGYGDDVGGISGRLGGTLINAHSSGAVSGDENVGGLVGFVDEGMLANSYSEASVNGSDGVGGLVGRNSRGIIKQSYATGSVTGEQKVGGLSGANGGVMQDVYATGDVEGINNVGGLSGRNGGIINNAYSVGAVALAGGKSLMGIDEYIGGLVGYMDSGDGHGNSVNESFWNTETSGQEDSPGGVGKTTLEMEDIATFTGAGWDFSNVWEIDEIPLPTLRQGPLFNDGDGSEEAPYEITSCEELSNIRFQTGSYFLVTDNIDCAETENWNRFHLESNYFDEGDGEQTTFDLGTRRVDTDSDFIVWVDGVEQDPGDYTVDGENGTITFNTPPESGYELASDFYFFEGFIPIGSGSFGFHGEFDGDNNTISNLYINFPFDGDIGIFSRTEEGEYNGWNSLTGKSFGKGGYGNTFSNIHNVYLEDVYVSGRDTVGALVGESNSVVSNVGTSGIVIGHDRIGGVVGLNRNDARLLYSFSNADVTATNDKAGGLSGGNGGTIENSYATGDVTSGGEAGGLSGRSGGYIYNSYAVGAVTSEGEDGGGLVGYQDGGEIADSFWDTERSGLERSGLEDYENDGDIGKTTSEMRNIRTFTDYEYNENLSDPWDFQGNEYDDGEVDDIWDIDENLNGGYPFLFGQAFIDVVDVEDNSLAPSVTTNSASSITKTSATLIGNITDDGGETITSRGFYYGLTDGYGSTKSSGAGSYDTGSFTLSVTGLQCGKTYHFKAWAVNDVDTSVGNDKTFHTSQCSSGGGGGGSVNPSNPRASQSQSSVQNNSQNNIDSLVSQIKLLVAMLQSQGINIPSETLNEVSKLLAVTPQNTTVRDLTVGMSGEDVRSLQKILITADKGPKSKALSVVGATGEFRGYTENALGEYQSLAGISPAIGYFGVKTRAYMKSVGVSGIWW